MIVAVAVVVVAAVVGSVARGVVAVEQAKKLHLLEVRVVAISEAIECRGWVLDVDEKMFGLLSSLL